MKLQKSSSTALLVVSVAFAVIGGMIPAPEGRLLSFLLGGAIASVVLFFGPSWKRRIIALFIIVVVALQTIPTYRQYEPFHKRQRAVESHNVPMGN